MPEEPSTPRTPEQAAEALRRTALRMAIEYHGQAAQHPKSRGMAKPATVTATADQFEDWLREVAARAEVTADDLDPTPGPSDPSA